MKIQCPQCAVIGSVDDSYRGKKVKCPKCSEIFVVSGDLPTPPASPPEPTPPPQSLSEPDPLKAAQDDSQATVSEAVWADQPTVAEGDTVASPEIQGTAWAEEPAADPTSRMPSDAVSGDPLTEPDETIDWADIVSEMDKERRAEEIRGR